MGVVLTIQMLWVSTDITKFKEFRDMFRKTHEDKTYIDLSKVSMKDLVEQSDAIIQHQRNCVVFLGHLEPGWMLEPMHQTRLRKLFRKFETAIVTHFTESLPFSWKTEIDTIYTLNTFKQNG